MPYGPHDLIESGQFPALAGRTVLQIIPDLEAGGAERTTIDIATALTEAGARALVASQGGRLVSELQARGGVWLPFPAKTKNPLSMMVNIRRLAALIARERIDIVHARSRAPAWVALGATRAMRVPFVTTYHGAYSGTSSIKIRYNSVMARADYVIANSEFTKRRILDQHPFADGHVTVIHRGTDFRAFTPAAVDPARVRRLRQQWGVEPDERIILLAARLTGWKGQTVLVDAAALMRRQGLNGVKFVLAGDPQGRSSFVKDLESRIATAGLGDLVKLVGHCDDMPAAFLAASAVAVPSTEPEAFGRSAVEAQAMGAPVIVTELGAVPETVLGPPEAPAAARTGWRIPPGDPQALANALSEALAMGAVERDALALRARQHVERHFSLDHMCKQTLALYEGIIRGF
ncbi:MAG TPA: glycosyltransferase family 4 protein [Beijerinckiaceae bacterium]|jgi:glycosyltransferase involved in cell wall biosynthesis|nr:glycosyltransferase family 4 protein [Beijerinckiaceae bacterium]